MTVKVPHYFSSAYRSDETTLMPLAQFASDRDRNGIFDTHIAYGHYAFLDPVTEISLQLESNEHLIYEHRIDLNSDPELYCDAKRWRLRNSSKTVHLLHVAKLLSFPCTWLFWGSGFLTQASLEFESRFMRDHMLPIGLATGVAMIASLILGLMNHKATHYLQLTSLVICTAMLLYLRGTIWGTSALFLAYWSSVFIYFMGVIGCDLLLRLYSLYGSPDGGEFNRIDGMVRFKRRFSRPFVAPFGEFDPVLRALPTGFGSGDYTIVLRHRYTGDSLTLAAKMHTLGLDKVNALAFWDCLQRYMDVTQPLPDLPVLEQSRHRDPVTAEHDLRTGRPERRWRDQALLGWKTGGERRLRAQLERYPWQQHDCIVKARLSGTLRIQDYYRALEAKGLKITPDSCDYACMRMPER